MEGKQGRDEKKIIAEMLENELSPYWIECYTYVISIVNKRLSHIPKEDREDITQNILCKIIQYLPRFRYESAFKTWVFQIILSGISDHFRRPPMNEERLYLPSADPNDENESEDFRAIEVKSAEVAFEQKEALHAIMLLLLEYVKVHKHSERNRRILYYVMVERRTYVDTAKIVRCQPAVVGHVVREAQLYVRQKMGYKP